MIKLEGLAWLAEMDKKRSSRHIQALIMTQLGHLNLAL
jgi:hypothetical protein